MAGEMHLDIFGGCGGAQQAGTPVHDAIGAGIDRGRRHRQVAGDRLPDLRIVVDRLRPTALRTAASRWSR